MVGQFGEQLTQHCGRSLQDVHGVIEIEFHGRD
jgi:hypothetical protein